MAFVREGALMSDEMREHVSHHDVRSGAAEVARRL